MSRMIRSQRSLPDLTLGLALSFAALGCHTDVTSPRASRSYQVTIENLTGGQPFSPGVLVTHNVEASLWRNGAPSSPGIIAIAEDGNNSVALASLTGAPGVSRVVAIDAPTFALEPDGLGAYPAIDAGDCSPWGSGVACWLPLG